MLDYLIPTIYYYQRKLLHLPPSLNKFRIRPINRRSGQRHPPHLPVLTSHPIWNKIQTLEGLNTHQLQHIATGWRWKTFRKSERSPPNPKRLFIEIFCRSHGLVTRLQWYNVHYLQTNLLRGITVMGGIKPSFPTTHHQVMVSPDGDGVVWFLNPSRCTRVRSTQIKSSWIHALCPPQKLRRSLGSTFLQISMRMG